MIIAGTGHRPEKLGGYDPHTAKKVLEFATLTLKHFQPACVISGMAQGWDMALAQAAINLNIPFKAYVPFVGQELMWPSATRLYYKELLKRAHQIYICSEGGFTRAAMQKRNIEMVNACDLVVALWNGSPGGTANCIDYVSRREKPYINVWHNFETGEAFDVQETTGDDGHPSFTAGADWLGP